MKLEHEMEFSKMYAQWWMAMATSKACLTSRIFHGDGTEYTDQEKIEGALDTAERHIKRYRELGEALLSKELADNASK